MRPVYRLLRDTVMALALLPGAALLTGCGDDDDDYYPVNPADLPGPAMSFLYSFFPGDPVYDSEYDDDDFDEAYEATLSSGTEIKFDGAGNWTSIDMPGAMYIPQGILPVAAEMFIMSNYPGLGPNEASVRYNGAYEVELTNGVELLFGPDGTFLGADF